MQSPAVEPAVDDLVVLGQHVFRYDEALIGEVVEAMPCVCLGRVSALAYKLVLESLHELRVAACRGVLLSRALAVGAERGSVDAHAVGAGAIELAGRPQEARRQSEAVERGLYVLDGLDRVLVLVL